MWKNLAMLWRALGAAILAPATALAATPSTDLSPFVARQLAPGVHLLATPPEYRGGVIGNVTVIEQSRGVVLIDSGGTAADGRRVVGFVRSVTDKPVTALLLTHWHGDHPQGASEIRASWPDVRIIATERTRDSIRSAASRYMGFSPDERFETIHLNQVSGLLRQFEEAIRNPSTEASLRERYRRALVEQRARLRDLRGTYLVEPTETFDRELLLDDPVRPVRLLHPGRANTDGDAIAWLPNERIVVMGDIVVAPIPFGFFSFPGDWLQALQAIRALDFRMLVPGHGEPQQGTDYLDRLDATLRDLRAQIGPLARDGVSLDEIRRRVNWEAQRDIFGDTPRNRMLFDAYWLDPMTVNTFIEARGLPMEQGDESLYSAGEG